VICRFLQYNVVCTGITLLPRIAQPFAENSGLNITATYVYYKKFADSDLDLDSYLIKNRDPKDLDMAQLLGSNLVHHTGSVASTDKYVCSF